jgi:hypothetical protein
MHVVPQKGREEESVPSVYRWKRVVIVRVLNAVQDIIESQGLFRLSNRL